MTFNVWTFLFEIANFIVLAYVLYRLLYRPLQKAIDERRDASLRAQADLEKAQKETVDLQTRLKAEMIRIDQLQEEAIAKARTIADSERKDMLHKVEMETERTRSETKRSLEREREEALVALRKKVVDLAIGIVERLLREASDRTLHEQLARHLIDHVKSLTQADCQALRNQWKHGDKFTLETAQELDPAITTEFKDIIAQIIGQPTDVELVLIPALLSGACLKLAGRVWDSSLAGQLVAIRQAS